MDIGTFLFSSTLNTKTLTSTTSDEDDHHHPLPSSSAATAVPAKNPSPWHRMKWTDDIVRLLINLVSFVGDEVAPSSSSAGGGGGVLHKKAKWKTVSKLMLDNGCYVSPQQCEDKFNDLNKRYKRLNEILGRGTTCQVVENPSLLDSMHHIPEKSKLDVRKILSSKHLFYREMCAYHNGQRIPNSHGSEVHDRGGLRVSDVSEEEEEEEEEDGVGKSRVASLEVEISALSEGEKREWLRKQALQLLEERVEIEAQGLKLEEKRAKWERFKRKKDWEMEKSRMENERLELENERMVLQVRRKEMELESSLVVEGNGMMMFGEHGRDQ